MGIEITTACLHLIGTSDLMKLKLNKSSSGPASYAITALMNFKKTPSGFREKELGQLEMYAGISSAKKRTEFFIMGNDVMARSA